MINFPIADGHCDFLYGAMEHGYDMGSQRGEQVTTLKHLHGGNVALQCFAVWTDDKLKTPPMLQAMTQIDAYHRMLAKYADLLVPFTRDFVPKSDKIATVLTVEGAECLCGSKAALRDFYRLGVRSLAFTWNNDNELACAADGKRQRGLSALGREILNEMNALGMALDVSHLADAGIDDALRLSSLPIYASHSNARTLCPAARCLKDEHIRAIADGGGVVGVNFYGPQLCGDKSSCIQDIVRHITHIVGVGGINACCIGSDFDGMTAYPRNLKNALDFSRLCRTLLDSGFCESDVKKISYENLATYLSHFV